MHIIMSKKELEKDKLPVRVFREELGLTRSQVRLQTGIAERTLIDIEAGKSIPTVESLLALARLYKKSLKQILKAINLDVSDIPDDEELSNKKSKK
ncbi:hypothetical protein STA3757_03940 [Stanieria sp. NIES-3757]|nr:hypothetical protein STA3757_03940 [Stanieria sp. NIES-3757]